MINLTKIEKAELNELIKKLDSFKKTLEECDHTHEIEYFFSTMRQFRKFVASVENETLCDNFFHSKYYEEYRIFFRDKNYYYMRAVETIEAASIIEKWTHRWSFVKLIDREYIKERYIGKTEEVKHLDLKQIKQLVVVGCWPMPETMIYIYENTKVDNIIGLDNSREAIFTATRMIKWLGIKNIKLLCIDGIDYNYQDADAVYIPGFTYPKEKILNRIATTGKNSVQILVRTPNLLWKMLFDDIEKLHSRLVIRKSHNSNRDFSKYNMLNIEKYNH